MRRLVPSIAFEVLAMPKIQFEITEEHRILVSRAHDEFHYVFGLTLSSWARVERTLSYWFARLTRMNTSMATAVFYSGRSFNARAEMLQAAIDRAKGLTSIETEFIKEATKRAWAYSGFRNRIAHGEPILNMLHDDQHRPKAFHYSLTQGASHPRDDASLEHMQIAAENFQKLQELILTSLPNFNDKKKPLEELLQLLRTTQSG